MVCPLVSRNKEPLYGLTVYRPSMETTHPRSQDSPSFILGRMKQLRLLVDSKFQYYWAWLLPGQSCNIGQKKSPLYPGSFDSQNPMLHQLEGSPRLF